MEYTVVVKFGAAVSPRPMIVETLSFDSDERAIRYGKRLQDTLRAQDWMFNWLEVRKGKKRVFVRHILSSGDRAT